MLLWILLGMIVVLSIGCCVFKDLLYVAVCLATISGLLALVLFMFGANIAGVFELSVCAGLITVLFISTVSLTKDSDKAVETRLPAYFVPLVILLFIGIDFFIIHWISNALPPVVTPQPSGTFQRVFWELRSADILGQIGLIGAGVFGILTLFRVTTKEKKHE